MPLKYQMRRREHRELYAQIFEIQNGLCAICRCRPELKKRFCFDHDHKTNQIRGLLCTRCNAGIGYFRDNTNALYSAVRYLDSKVSYGEVY
jgi:hypothetical protein